MKKPSFLFATIFAFAALTFFACSNDPDDQGDNSSSSNELSSSSNDYLSSSSDKSGLNNNSSSSSENKVSSSSGNNDVNGATDINPQVYTIQCTDKNNPETCDFKATYTGSGVIKHIATKYDEYDEQVPIDTIEIGSVTNGRMNWEFFTPKKELLNENGWHCLNLSLFNNSNEFVGLLLLRNYDYVNKDKYNDYDGGYCYISEDYKKQDTHYYDGFGEGNQILTWIYDYDMKKGWNLLYKKYDIDNRGDKEVVIFTYTNHSGILDGNELNWFFYDKELLEEEEFF
jgi:hypothetical protein